MSLINFYERCSDEHKPSYHNPDRLAPHHPFRQLIIGKSGAGKTSAALNIILRCNCFSRVHLVAPRTDEPMYLFLKERLDDVDKSIFRTYNSIDDMPRLDEIDAEHQNLIILDDIVSESKKELSKLFEYFIRCRKLNCSIMLLTQAYYPIPRTIRLQCNYLCILSINSRREVQAIVKDMALGIDLDAAVKRMRGYTENHQFCMIDVDNPDPSMRIRHNFGDG